MPLQILVKYFNLVPLIRVRGDLDSCGCPSLLKQLKALSQGRRQPRIQVDLSGLGAIDGQGAALLASCAEELEKGGGRLAISGASNQVTQTLAALGVPVEVRSQPPTPIFW